MRLYRVTGFNGETREEFNLGFYVALSRDGAIAAARSRLNRGLVLDACEVKELTAEEDLLFANAPWPKRGGAARNSEPIAEFADRLADAYSTDNYGGDWGPCIKALRRRDLTDREIEAVIRSKWTRWAADNGDRPYGRASAQGLIRYMDSRQVFGKNFEQLRQLVRESGL